MRKKFVGIKTQDLDSLPDSIHQEINDGCARIMVAALTRDGKEVSENIAMGALQKACAVILGSFFEEEAIEEATNQIFQGIRSNIKVFKRPDLQAGFFDE